jgi:cell division protein FtsI/penicillin-binding protein 2
MAGWRRWIGIGTAAGLIAALIPIVQGDVSLQEPLRKLSAVRAKALSNGEPNFSGLDLLRLDVRPRRVTAGLTGGRMAELTLDAELQRAASAEMRRYRIPEAGVVVMDVKSGKLLVYASHVASGTPFDVNVRAEAPAASIFKVVTGAALVEKAGLNANTEQCYHGGKSRLMPEELEDNARRDKWCATLGMAMGRSLNVVFGRLARKNITPEDLTAVGGALGFGAAVPFPVPNEPPKIDIPAEPLEFARSAAGFWHTSLSPLAGAVLAQTVANGGVALEPRLVASIQRGDKQLWADGGAPRVMRRAIKASTAQELTKMMIETTRNGSAHKSFFDARGRPYVPGVTVAGKTGTLNREEANRFYTWFVGFAPAEQPEVAISVLVVNTPSWQIKAPQLAASVLRAHFGRKSPPAADNKR